MVSRLLNDTSVTAEVIWRHMRRGNSYALGNGKARRGSLFTI